jgi:hypothetical protein
MASLKEVASVTHTDIAYAKNIPIGPVGTVLLIDHNEVVLIPTPSPDPRGKSAS